MSFIFSILWLLWHSLLVCVHCRRISSFSLKLQTPSFSHSYSYSNLDLARIQSLFRYRGGSRNDGNIDSMQHDSINDDEYDENIGSNDHKYSHITHANNLITSNASYIDTIREVWSNFIVSPSKDHASRFIPEAILSQNYGTSEEDPKRRAYYDALVAQFSHPLDLGSRYIKWIKPEIALNLRGKSLLALKYHQLQQLIPSLASSSSPTPRISLSSTRRASHISPASDKSFDEQKIVNRSFTRFRHQLSIPRGFHIQCPTGTASLVRLIVRALAQSIGASLVTIGDRTLDVVRIDCMNRGVPESVLSCAHLLAVLLDMTDNLAGKSSIGMIVHFQLSESNSLLSDEADGAFLELLGNELRNSSSKTIVFRSSRDPSLPVGSSDFPSRQHAFELESARDKVVEPPGGNVDSAGDASAATNPNFSFSSIFPAGMIPPNIFQPSATNVVTSSSQENSRGLFQYPVQNGMIFGGPLPPGFNVNIMRSQPASARSYQVTFRNGSATVKLLPQTEFAEVEQLKPKTDFPFFSVIPTAEPPVSPAAASVLSPPTSFLKQIIQNQQKIIQIQEEIIARTKRSSVDGTSRHREHPDALDANIAAQLESKDFLDHILKLAAAQLPPGALAGTGVGESNIVEVKVTVVPVPNFAAMNPNQALYRSPNDALGSNLRVDDERNSSFTGSSHQLQNFRNAIRTHSMNPNRWLKSLLSTSRGKDNDAVHSTGHDSTEDSPTEPHHGAHSGADEPLPSPEESLLENGDVIDRIDSVSDDSSKTCDDMSPDHRSGLDDVSSDLNWNTLQELFEIVKIPQPDETRLRQEWKRMADDEIAVKISNVNGKMFEHQLMSMGCVVRGNSSATILNSTQESLPFRGETRDSFSFAIHFARILGRKIMSEAEVREAIQRAVVIQVSKEQADCGSGAKSDICVDPTLVENRASPEAYSLFEISPWALEASICQVLQIPHSLLPAMVVRSIEQLTATITDKHERGLLTNLISPRDIGTSYEMIGGLDEVKEMLRQSITYPLKYPQLYQEGLASEAVKGVLLFGPPGTGKTMLAKAVATEGGATFLNIDASIIENKWLGESEKNAKAVFTLARKLAPCVIFIDEVDSVLSSRERNDDSSSHGTITSVKTTLMQEWDGLSTTRDRVIVIASTNRPFDLDEAVLRRLPRRIMVSLPDLQTRLNILQVSLAGNRLDSTVNLTALAVKLEGYTGSDIKEVCREAVVKVSHEAANQLERGTVQSSTEMSTRGFETLRPVSWSDFEVAMKKLKSSVDENGKEMQKVIDWNKKYGEVRYDAKRNSRPSPFMSMYI